MCLYLWLKPERIYVLRTTMVIPCYVWLVDTTTPLQVARRRNMNSPSSSECHLEALNKLVEVAALDENAASDSD